MYNNLLKRILFPSLSIYFFPHFFTFFPIPKSKFLRILGKNGNFFYFENRNFVSLSFHILFFPILAHPQIQISVCLGEKWGWTPPITIVVISITILFVLLLFPQPGNENNNNKQLAFHLLSKHKHWQQ